MTQRRRLIVRVALGFLAISQVTIGGWALFAPAGFYERFPAAGHAWVATLPPFNEHLVRDVGAFSLALTVLLVGAAIRPDRFLATLAALAFAAYAVPHTVFHGLHLDTMATGDAVAQMAGFALQLLLIVVVLAAAQRTEPATSGGPAERRR